MAFRFFRTRSKSSSKSDRAENKSADPPEEDLNDFQKFLRQAQREEEAAEQKRLKGIKMAEKQMKQINMNPWEARM